MTIPGTLMATRDAEDRRPLLSVEDLVMHYRVRAGDIGAVDGVSFTLEHGGSLGLVGESGCGKTSIAICLLRLLPDNAQIKGGHIYFDEVDLVALPEEQMREYRWNRISMVFQAAMNSLNPVYRVGDQIIEAMQTHWEAITVAEARERVVDLFELVGLEPSFVDRYPHEFSGGMRQRAVIAMALSCNPDIIIADEPTTALDVIVQDRVLRKLEEIQRRLDMALIYISHDIAVIAEVSDRIGVMYAGRMAELASSVEVFERPLHPYTYALIGAFPSIKGEKKALSTLPGEPPDLLNPPPGCRFHPRCSRALDVCREEQPAFRDHGGGHYAACWNPVEVD
jgi:peptide/nickel transport system ATP-binding protein